MSITLRLPRAKRSTIDGLGSIQVQAQNGRLVPLSEIVKVEQVEQVEQDGAIYHKNLKPVVYVTAESAGREESPVYQILQAKKAIDKMTLPEGYALTQYWVDQPFSTGKYSMKWGRRVADHL